MKWTIAVAFAGAVITLPSLAADVGYRGEIRPMINARCAECHGDASPTLADFLLEPDKFKKETVGPRLSSYSELLQLIGWPDTGALMRRLDDGTNTADKKPGNMYKHLGETEAERAANLTLVKAWLGAQGAWNLNRWENKGPVPAITKEQLDKLKLKY